MTTTSAHDRGPVRLCLLGPVSLDWGGRSHRLPRAQTRGILGLLAVRAEQRISLTEAMEALWGGAEPASARSQLHTAVSKIRRQLTHAGAAMKVEGGCGGYRLRTGDDEIDLAVFDQYVSRAREAGADGSTNEAVGLLRKGLSMWRGDPLADASGDFLEPIRANLTARKLEAIEQLADLQLLRREHAALTRELEPYVAAHPLRETLRCRLLVALYRSGRQCEALLNTAEYRHLLADSYGLDPGAELVALELAIRRNDPALADPLATAAAVGTASGPYQMSGPHRRTQAPWQLPLGVAALVGREAQLDALSATAQRPTGGRIALVTGMPGVGKTALTVQWGHAARAAFPDGAVYVDLHGFGRGRPLTPLEALHKVLNALGVAQPRLPDDPDDAAALLRSHTATRRCLLILDNARSAAQVRPLLPGTGACMVVVTSRDSLPGLLASHDVLRIDVPVLSTADGISLLRHELGPNRAAAEPEPTARLVKSCGGLPLAICAIAAKLRDAPDRSLLHQEAILRAQGLSGFDIRGDTGSGVRPALSSTYAVQPDPARRLLLLLGTLSGPEISLAAAVAVDGRNEPAVQADLESLLGVHLLERRGSDRYGLHHLTRAFAQELHL